MIDGKTDAEVVETMRQNMQRATDAAISAHAEGKTFDEFSDNYGLPTEARRVTATALRLLGTFILDFGNMHSRAPVLMRTQWVFHHAAENAVYVVGIENVIHLDNVGYATLRAFVDAGDAN